MSLPFELGKILVIALTNTMLLCLCLSPSLWEPRATLKLLCWKDHMNKSYKEMPKDPQLFWAPSVLVFPVQALDS